jgi:hypothetical protein
MSRILVTDAAGRVLYDTRETGSAVGQYAVLYRDRAGAAGQRRLYLHLRIRRRLPQPRSSPVLYHNQIIGAVYAYEYDTDQAALLAGFQSNLQRLSVIIAVLVLGFSWPCSPGR